MCWYNFVRISIHWSVVTCMHKYLVHQAPSGVKHFPCSSIFTVKIMLIWFILFYFFQKAVFFFKDVSISFGLLQAHNSLQINRFAEMFFRNIQNAMTHFFLDSKVEILFPICSHSVPSVLLPSYVGLIKTFFSIFCSTLLSLLETVRSLSFLITLKLFLVFIAQVSKYVFLFLLRYIDLEKIHFATEFPLQFLPHPEH